MNSPFFRCKQNELNRSEIRPLAAHLVAERLADQGESFFNHWLATYRRHPIGNTNKPLLNFLQRLAGHLSRSSFRKFHCGSNNKTINFWKNLKFNQSSLYQSQGEHQGGKGNGQGNVSPVQNAVKKGHVSMFNKTDQSVLHELLPVGQ